LHRSDCSNNHLFCVRALTAVVRNIETLRCIHPALLKEIQRNAWARDAELSVEGARPSHADHPLEVSASPFAVERTHGNCCLNLGALVKCLYSYGIQPLAFFYARIAY